MTVKSLIAFLFLFTLLNSQPWGIPDAGPPGGFDIGNQGARLAHLYSGEVQVERATDSGTDSYQNLTDPFTTAIAEGIFDTTETIYSATGKYFLIFRNIRHLN